MKETKQQDWINELCKKHSVINTRVLTPKQVDTWLSEYNQVFGASCTAESFKRMLRKGKVSLLVSMGMLEEEEITSVDVQADDEIIESNVRFQKDKQRFMDTNRIERKAFREYARVENAVSAYAQSMEALVKAEGARLSSFNPLPLTNAESSKEIGMVQISDCHLNELINLPHNKYDIGVASHRLHKLAMEALIMFSARGIKKIVVAFTGDNLNSDRRLDELLNQATNRSKATFVAVELFSKFLRHLGEHFHVTVVGVLGNESRVNKEMSFSNESMSDNYDFVICNMLRMLFEASEHPNVHFGSIDTMELVVNVGGTKVLLTHDLARATSSQKGAQNVIGKQYLTGSPVDVVIGGHIHATNNGAYSFRSGSLAGSNSYNENAMHLAGRASQNIYVFGERQRMCTGIDLQNYIEGNCYDIAETLMTYDCRSLHDVSKKHEVLEVVV